MNSVSPFTSSISRTRFILKTLQITLNFDVLVLLRTTRLLFHCVWIRLLSLALRVILRRLALVFWRIHEHRAQTEVVLQITPRFRVLLGCSSWRYSSKNLVRLEKLIRTFVDEAVLLYAVGPDLGQDEVLFDQLVQILLDQVERLAPLALPDPVAKTFETFVLDFP